MPAAVIAVHSKRAAEITAECDRRGESSYRARSVAARATRRAKQAEGVEAERQRPIWLHPIAVQILQAWRTEVERAAAAAGVAVNSEGYIFTPEPAGAS